MFYTKRVKGFAKFVTDEALHKTALQKMINSGLYEFELISDSIGDMTAVRFSVAEVSIAMEKESLFKEFYAMYWSFVEDIKKELKLSS